MEKKRAEERNTYIRYSEAGVTVVDIKTGNTFKYQSVRECIEAMNVPKGRVYKGIYSGKEIKGHIYKCNSKDLTEEEINKRKESNAMSVKAYYLKNAEKMREKHRKSYSAKRGGNVKEGKRSGKAGLIIIDTTTGEEFEYRSVRECSEDMDITKYQISKGLNRNTIYDGYKFKRREDI